MNKNPGSARSRARPSPPSLATRGGQYLTFALGPVECAIEILKVQDIVGMMPVTLRAGVPDFIRGNITLRGNAIPLVDLRARLSLPPQDETENTCIIVVETAGTDHTVTPGLLVDAVREVSEIPEEELLPPQDTGAPMPPEFILAMAHAGGTRLLVLDIERVLEPASSRP